MLPKQFIINCRDGSLSVNVFPYFPDPGTQLLDVLNTSPSELMPKFKADRGSDNEAKIGISHAGRIALSGHQRGHELVLRLDTGQNLFSERVVQTAQGDGGITVPGGAEKP